jgi:hypothetical protein
MHTSQHTAIMHDSLPMSTTSQHRYARIALTSRDLQTELLTVSCTRTTCGAQRSARESVRSDGHYTARALQDMVLVSTTGALGAPMGVIATAHSSRACPPLLQPRCNHGAPAGLMPLHLGYRCTIRSSAAPTIVGNYEVSVWGGVKLGGEGLVVV